MNGRQFEEWMKKNDLRVADVASKTRLDPNTVYAFRRGKNVHWTTRDILLRFVTEYETAHTGGNEAAG